MPISGGAEVKLYWNLLGVLGMNVFGAQVSGGVTFNVALANVVGAAIKSAFTAQLAAQFATATALVRVGVRDLRQDNLPEFRDTGPSVFGTGVGDAMPGNVALCVTSRTALAGKSFRGRTYLAGWSEAANGPGGTAVAGVGTAALAYMNAVQAGMLTNGLTMAVLSRPHERQTLVETTFHADGTTTTRTLSTTTAKSGLATPIVSFESRNLGWESQRRRINGRGAAPSTLLEGETVEVSRAASSP